MTRARYLLLGVLLAVAGGALAVSGGGFPSVPVLQAVKIGGQRPAAAPCVTRACLILGTTPGTASGAQITMSADTAPLDSKVWDNYVDSTGAMHFRLINDATASAQDWLTVSRSGVSVSQIDIGNNTNNTTVNVDSFRVPRISFGEFITNGSSCSNNSGVWQTQNMGGGCSRFSTGVFTVTFNTAYHGSPICTANITSATAGAASVNTASTTSVTVGTVNTAFAATDSLPFFVTCVGF
jgi:hypothetical protein